MSAALYALATAGTLHAQCVPPLQTLTSGSAHIWAVEPWDPDGPGPAQGFAVGGTFTSLGGVTTGHVAFYDTITGTCSAIGGGITGTAVGSSPPSVYALSAMPNGDLVAAGFFDTAGGVSVNNIARWNGTSWTTLGSGLLLGGSAYCEVRALNAAPNGNLIAGGLFDTAGVVAANGIAEWNGTAWSPLSSGVTLGGSFGLVFAMARMPNGDLAVGGDFSAAGGISSGSVALWTGTAWSPLNAGGSGQVLALTVTADGDLYAGGTLAIFGGALTNVARFGAATGVWSSLGSGVSIFGQPGTVHTLAALPDRSVVAGGYFDTAGTVPAQSVARWHNNSWRPVASTSGVVLALASAKWGPTDVMLGTANSGPAGFALQRFATNCPAGVTTYYAGCPSSGGSNTLTALNQPWVECLQTHLATGLPNSGFVWSVMSLTSVLPAFPLSAIFPQAGAGCDIAVAPDILQSIPIVSGSAAWSFFLPNTPVIAGLNFYHQMLVFDVDATGALVGITATNALALAAGGY